MTRRATPAGDGDAKTTAAPRAAATPRAPRKPTVAKAAPVSVDPTPQTALALRMAHARSVEEADARYVAARDAWTAAMRAANSGRPADLASLAITQEAYEAAATERERWHTGTKVAIHVDDEKPNGIEAAVSQELAWRKVLHPEQPKGGVLARIRRRLRGG
jgi:hypothetical protein